MGQRSFDSLTKRGQRLRIARDVLTQISTRKIKATTGMYLDFFLDRDDLERDKYGNVTLEESVRDVLKNAKTCQACAMGGMFASAVRAKNGLSLSDVDADVLSNPIHDDDDIEVSIDRSAMDERLKEYFDIEQLRLIECAFEISSGFWNGDYEEAHYDYDRNSWVDSKFPESVNRAVEFGRRYANPTKRMQAIMKNIIANNGEFKP